MDLVLSGCTELPERGQEAAPLPLLLTKSSPPPDSNHSRTIWVHM